MRLALLLAATPRDAVAHPLGERGAGQTTAVTLRVGDEGVLRIDVDYYADVPDAFLATTRGPRAPGVPADEEALAEAMALELASGLLLTVDGEVVSMVTRTPSPPPRRTSEHTVGFAVHLGAAAPLGVWDDGAEVEVSTANLQEASNAFAGDVRVDPRLPVQASSLLALDSDGRIARDDTLRFLQGDLRRRLSVTVREPLPAWWTTVAGLGDEPVRCGKAFVPPAASALAPPRITPASWGVALGLAGVLGASGGAGRAAGWALAVAGLGVALAVAPGEGSGAVELGSAVVVAGLLATARVRPVFPGRSLALGAAAAGIAATQAAPVAALSVALSYALGAASARWLGRSGGRLSDVGMAVTVAALLVRGWLARG